MKRTIDLALASIALIASLPLFIPICIVLKFVGERRVFYRQSRIGLFGCRFQLIKFTTMMDSIALREDGGLALDNDPEIFTFGRFLRKTKLNELPQILNVIRGEMSIVGPRPLTEKTFFKYATNVQSELKKVKPGITGVGSIIFRDEERMLSASSMARTDCYEEEILPRKGRLELWYVNNMSVFLDLKIIVATLIVIVFPRANVTKLISSGIPS